MVASRYGKQDENKLILVYLEQANGVFEDVSLELLAKGREMADQVGWNLSGLIMGHQGLESLAQIAIHHGADQVYMADHPLLEHFTVEAYTHMAFETLLQFKPSVFLLGATPDGRDLAGRLAVRLRTGLNADCTGLHINPENGVLVCEVSGFGGGVLALIEMQNHRPQMATVRPGVFEPHDALNHPHETESTTEDGGRSKRLETDLNQDMIQTQILEQVIGEQVSLARVPMLIAGGRGIDGDFQLLQELAHLLGGEVGATRPPVDEGHIERERQIGQTGVVCSPKIAICCGISGAFHFVVGIEKAGTVISINSDPEAPIFEYSDYCIVGDVHQIIPELIAELQRSGEVTYA